MRITRKLTCFTLLFAVVVSTAIGQNAIRIGEWRAHIPYSAGTTVTQDDDKVYYGAGDGLLSIQKDTTIVEFYSKVDGLSDVRIKLVKFQPSTGTLIVVYENSNVDLVYNTGILNVDDILNNNTIIGSKGINHVLSMRTR